VLSYASYASIILTHEDLQTLLSKDNPKLQEMENGLLPSDWPKVMEELEAAIAPTKVCVCVCMCVCVCVFVFVFYALFFQISLYNH
jgi:hypothetical protein